MRRATSGVLSEIQKVSNGFYTSSTVSTLVEFADRLDESCGTHWPSVTCAQRPGKPTADTYHTQNFCVSSYTSAGNV